MHHMLKTRRMSLNAVSAIKKMIIMFKAQLIYFSECKMGKLKFICQLCSDYTCQKYDKHVYNYNVILCNGCNKWRHQKRTGLNKAQYNELLKDNSEKPWYCRQCQSSMFYFFNFPITNFVASWIQQT